VNASRYASKLLNNDDDNRKNNVPLHAIVGGYHLATASDVKNIDATVSDLKSLDPAIMMAGHCTGWRAKFCIEREMPGSLVPCAVGMTYTF
jgi:7,8-dihydropterin-6-yl-methyl-4-(beta-D-ribofuranosyl)aminobenzene 5'-phosphate synthase